MSATFLAGLAIAGLFCRPQPPSDAPADRGASHFETALAVGLGAFILVSAAVGVLS